MSLATRYRAACRALGIPVWQLGMRTSSRFERVVTVDTDTGDPACAEAGATEDDCACVWMPLDLVEPDFSDPATLGCLLAAAREAWACPILRTSWEGPDLSPGEPLPETGRMFWRAWLPGYPVGYGATEAEALVAALESAAARKGSQS